MDNQDVSAADSIDNIFPYLLNMTSRVEGSAPHESHSGSHREVSEVEDPEPEQDAENDSAYTDNDEGPSDGEGGAAENPPEKAKAAKPAPRAAGGGTVRAHKGPTAANPPSFVAAPAPLARIVQPVSAMGQPLLLRRPIPNPASTAWSGSTATYSSEHAASGPVSPAFSGSSAAPSNRASLSVSSAEAPSYAGFPAAWPEGPGERLDRMMCQLLEMSAHSMALLTRLVAAAESRRRVSSASSYTSSSSASSSSSSEAPPAATEGGAVPADGAPRKRRKHRHRKHRRSRDERPA